MVEELSTSPSYLIKKRGTVSILWRTDPYKCDWEILRASDDFFFRHLAVENALERGSRWGIETLALAPFSAQFFYASLLVRTSPSLSSAW